MTWIRIAVFVAALVVTAIALMPLRFVLGFTPPADARLDTGFASGSVWSGELKGVRWQGEDLGDFEVGVSPGSLLVGDVRVNFTSTGPVREGEWRAGVDADRFDRLKGLVQLDRLVPAAPTGAFVSFLDGSIELDPAGCRRASGRVLVDGLADAGLSTMEGTIGCEARRLVVSLRPESGASLDLLYDIRTATVAGRSSDPATIAALAALGIDIETSEAT